MCFEYDMQTIAEWKREEEQTASVALNILHPVIYIDKLLCINKKITDEDIKNSFRSSVLIKLKMFKHEQEWHIINNIAPVAEDENMTIAFYLQQHYILVLNAKKHINI